jgi:hypothetical protein
VPSEALREQARKLRVTAQVEFMPRLCRSALRSNGRAEMPALQFLAIYFQKLNVCSTFFMQIKSIWEPIVKLAAVLAVLLSFVGAATACAGYFGWADKRPGVVALAMVFAAGLTIFAIVELIFTELALNREISQAVEIANKLANGEVFDEDTETTSELLLALKEISNYRQKKSAVLDKIASGNLSEDVVFV